MLQGSIKEGDVITADAAGDDLAFNVKQAPAPAPAGGK
jgi:hypothetical protein